jgi:amino acid transporter
MRIIEWIAGRPLRSDEQDDAKIGVAEGVPALGLDGLSSSAYGPEAALTILLPLGAAGLVCILPITGAILVLLTLLYFSYRQTIAAYPQNGGSYTVSKENLGPQASLLAAAALMLDYILTVAVGISAGIAALVSAVPHLHKYTVLLCIGTLVLITLMNLRGTADAGRAFAFPTYLFIAVFAVILGVGVFKSIAHGGHPAPVIHPPIPPAATEGFGIWILLRAFASGCAAMTGVEAVSNGVSAFKNPTIRTAHRTLTVIIVTLAILLGAIAYLAHSYQIAAMDQTKAGYQSVLSQLVLAVCGRGALYYVAIASVLAVLCLSANTSFVDFPRLCRLIAEDGYFPHAFAMLDRRLVLSVGILALAGAAGLLLVVFDGVTDRLIPLYAVGAFVAFTLSQSGMVMHWKKQKGHRCNMAVNAIGAVGTATALVVIILAKFIEGAWITIIAIPTMMVVFNLVHRYYRWYAKQISGHETFNSGSSPPVVVLPMRSMNRLTDKAIEFALRITDDVIGVHLSNVGGDEAAELTEQADQLQKDWRARLESPDARTCMNLPQLRIVPSPYRAFLDPFLNELKKIQEQYPDRQIAIIIPQLVRTHWWQTLLHDGRANRLRQALLQRGGQNVIVISVPWHLETKPG